MNAQRQRTPARFAATAERGTGFVWLVGELDMSTTPALAETVADLTPPVVLDCANLDFVDSSGLAEFVRLRERCGGQLRLVNLKPECHRVFEVTGLDTLFGLDPAD